MKKENKMPKGEVEMFFTRELFNSLVSILSLYIIAGKNTRYEIYAQKLKKKILKHSRVFYHNNQEKIVTYFYPTEASTLINLLTLALSISPQKTEDYFLQIEKNNNNINKTFN